MKKKEVVKEPSTVSTINATEALDRITDLCRSNGGPEAALERVKAFVHSL